MSLLHQKPAMTEALNATFFNFSQHQHQPLQKAKFHSHVTSRTNSKTSLDECDTTVDESFSPQRKDFHSSFNLSFNDTLDCSDVRSTSSNENQHEICQTVLNSALNLKKKIVPDESKFKTELCKNWSESGQCPYGKKCKFAHGRTELNERRVLNKGRYKSKKCASFHNGMFCSYGVRCLFAHEQRQVEELRNDFYYEKFMACPELMSFPLTQKKRRLPVFHSAEENVNGSFIQQEIPLIFSLEDEDEAELNFFSSF